MVCLCARLSCDAGLRSLGAELCASRQARERGVESSGPGVVLKWHTLPYLLIACELVERHLVGSRRCSLSRVEHSTLHVHVFHAFTCPSIQCMSTTITSNNDYQAHEHLPNSPISPWAEPTDLVVFSTVNAHYVTLAPRSPAKSQATLRTVLKLEKALQA
jgi:hypothetical protein